ncbi:MAG: hypothetical protein DRQ10_06020 [Candidatus Hydrothermota bacterium]|nr:MAG: hypothetical protein DRQ10_06020 [Candidatus Hydrothermae bacterium]
MRVLVISDTHIPHRAKALPDKVLAELKNCDLVIHAGDFTTFDFYLELKALAPKLLAVHGNMDDYQLFDELPEKLVFELEGHKIGLFHGFGAPFGIEKKVIQKFRGDGVELIVFGHTHRPMDKTVDNIRLFNPGSPTDYIFAIKRSYGIIEVQPDKLITKIIYL